MSSTTNIEGEITISPPIPWRLIKDSRFVNRRDRNSPSWDVELRVVEEAVDTEDGVLIRRHADAIVPTEDETSGRRVIEEIDEIIAEFGEGRTFTGRLDLEYRDYLTQSRVKVVNGSAVEFEPTIVWPEASE